MFTIKFDTRTALWIIQIQYLTFFWSTVKDKTFATHEEAEAYIKQTGIDRVYRPYRTSVVAEIMNSQVQVPHTYIIRQHEKEFA